VCSFGGGKGIWAGGSWDWNRLKWGRLIVCWSLAVFYMDEMSDDFTLTKRMGVILLSIHMVFNGYCYVFDLFI